MILCGSLSHSLNRYFTFSSHFLFITEDFHQSQRQYIGRKSLHKKVGGPEIGAAHKSQKVGGPRPAWPSRLCRQWVGVCVLLCRDASGMVLHKESQWFQSWQSFKDNNQFVHSQSQLRLSRLPFLSSFPHYLARTQPFIGPSSKTTVVSRYQKKPSPTRIREETHTHTRLTALCPGLPW